MTKVSPDTISYRIPPEERGWHELASAIVCCAVEDYRRSYRLSHSSEVSLIRLFFLSEVFENISGCDNPSMFVRRLDDQIEQEIRDDVKRKRHKQAMKCNG